jgi:threonine dehydrogenase-like Zn-dependent dehydrogenase
MRDTMVLPISKLHKSETLSLDQLALVETLGIGAHALERAALTAQDTVLVIGVGPIGLSVVEFVKQADLQVIVMDANPKRLEFCRRVFQVEDCILAGEDPIQEIRDRLFGDLPTVVFDCTGNSQSMTSAFGYVAHSGKLVFVGVFSGDVTFHDPMFHAREMTVLGSRNATAKDHCRIIQLMEAGKIDVRPWVTHRLSPAALLENFPGWVSTDSPAIKAMVDW